MTIDLAEAINTVLLEVEVIQNHLNELRDNALAALHSLTPDAQAVRLIVPWLSQIGLNASYAPGDCGAACVAMLVNFRNGSHITVDAASKASGEAPGYRSLSFQEMITAAGKFKVTLQHFNSLLDDILSDVDAGKPPIALVNYQSLPLYNRYDPKYNAGHYLLIVGYDARNVVYHDPYWPDEVKGAYKEISRDDFMRAYTVVAPGNSYSAHVLRIV